MPRARLTAYQEIKEQEAELAEDRFIENAEEGPAPSYHQPTQEANYNQPPHDPNEQFTATDPNSS